MCLNCGCGEPDARHKPTDITREDVQRAAEGSGLSLEQATQNMADSLVKVQSADRQESRT
jgi:major membrane immunogen (membrane-anchored lipoprotein)